MIILQDDTVATEQGIRIGDTKDAVLLAQYLANWKVTLGKKSE